MYSSGHSYFHSCQNPIPPPTPISNSSLRPIIQLPATIKCITSFHPLASVSVLRCFLLSRIFQQPLCLPISTCYYVSSHFNFLQILSFHKTNLICHLFKVLWWKFVANNLQPLHHLLFQWSHPFLPHKYLVPLSVWNALCFKLSGIYTCRFLFLD